MIKIARSYSVLAHCLWAVGPQLTSAADIQAQSANPSEVAAPSPLTKRQREEIELQAVSTVPYLIQPTEPASPPPALSGREHVKAERLTSEGGRTITYQLLDDPPPSISTKVTTEKQMASMDKKEPEPADHKRQAVLFLSNTVYDHKVTEMRWDRSGLHYRILINNLDFGLMRGVGRMTTPETTYTLVLGIGESTLTNENQPSESPAKKQLLEQFENGTQDFWDAAGFQLLQAKGSPADLTQTIEYKSLKDLLNFYAANRDNLIRQQDIQKAENEARKRWEDAQPRGPQNATLQFWPLKNPNGAGPLQK